MEEFDQFVYNYDYNHLNKPMALILNPLKKFRKNSLCFFILQPNLKFFPLVSPH